MSKKTVGFTIEIDGVDKVLKSFQAIQDEYKKQLKALKLIENVGSAEYKEQAKLVGALKGKMQGLNKEIRDQANEFKAIEEGVEAYKELERSTRKLKNESKELGAQLLVLAKTTGKNTDEYKALEKQYDKTTKAAQEQDEQLKGLDKTVGDSFRNVGNYKDGFVDAFEAIGGAAGGSISVVQNFNNTLKVLSANPLIFALAAIVGILGFLVNAFKKSEKGAEGFRKAGAFLQGVLSVLTSITVELFNWIVKVFEDNQESIKTFGNFLETEILNRIYGLVDGLMGLGKVMKSIFSGDFKAAKEAAKEAGDAFGNMFTGEENADGLKGKVEEFTEKVVAQGLAFSKLEAAKIQAAKTNRALTRQLEDLITQEEIFNQAAGDSSLTLAEQTKAADDAREALEKRAKVAIALAQNNLSLIQQEIGLKRAQGEDVTALLDTEVSAFSELKGAQRDYTLAVKNNATERRMITRDSAERTLDFLIDGVDNQKTINERLLKDDKLTYGQKQKLLKETKAEFDNSFAAQIKTIEDFAGVSIDSNSLILEMDNKVLDNKVKALGVDDIIAGRLLEIIRDRKTGLLDLSDAETELNTKHIEDNQKLLEDETELSKQLNEIKFEKGLVSQEQFNKKSLELDLELLQKSLENSSLKANEISSIKNEIELKELEITKQNLDLELEFIDNNYNSKKAALNKSLLDKEISESEHKERLTELDDNYELAKIEKLIENAEIGDEVLSELYEREIELNRDKNERITKQDEEARDRKLQIAKDIAGTVQTITDDLFAFQMNRAEGNEKKQKQIAIRQAKANKAMGIAQATVDTLVAFNKALATYPAPLSFIIGGLAVASGLANVAKIASTPLPMAQGGFTGRGVGQPDGTGQVPTQDYRLHGNEYIATSAQVNANPKLFSALESNRKGAALNMNTQPQILDNNNVTLQAINAMNNRFDNFTVIADPEKIVKIGLQRMEARKAKTL
jgi:hypothetical protein